MKPYWPLVLVLDRYTEYDAWEMFLDVMYREQLRDWPEV